MENAHDPAEKATPELVCFGVCNSGDHDFTDAEFGKIVGGLPESRKEIRHHLMERVIRYKRRIDQNDRAWIGAQQRQGFRGDEFLVQDQCV